MKSILFILLLPVFSWGQNIPLKANAIKVAGVDFKTAASLLIDQNYMIDQKDEEFGTIYTKPYSYSGGDYNIIIYVRIKDTVATITSKVNTNMSYVISGITFDERNYETVSKYSSNKAFLMMDKYAKSFGKPVEYLVVK